jgi:hypothetical protein
MGDSFLNLLERPIILTPQTDPNREPEFISYINVHQGHEGRGYKSRAAKVGCNETDLQPSCREFHSVATRFHLERAYLKRIFRYLYEAELQGGSDTALLVSLFLFV